jgi:hypothetical protein
VWKSIAISEATVNLIETSRLPWWDMADVVRLGAFTSHVAAGQAMGRGRRQVAPAFRHVLAASLTGGRTPHSATGANGNIHHAVLRAPVPARAEHPASMLPASADAALTQAIKQEGVPDSWQSGLRFIMAQESGGRVDAKNPVHSARGLFQLTAAQYHLNPNGVHSFGNAVEEAQGGIRYIQQRYGTADNAVAFWRQHRWY